MDGVYKVIVLDYQNNIALVSTYDENVWECPEDFIKEKEEFGGLEIEGDFEYMTFKKEDQATVVYK
jgi:hypothetical protein